MAIYKQGETPVRTHEPPDGAACARRAARRAKLTKKPKKAKAVRAEAQPKTTED